MSDYAKNYYGVPSDIGRRVNVDGKPGIIAEDRGHYIGVNFDSDKPGDIRNCHPTWRVENKMADKAGIYQVLWHPNDNGQVRAKDIVPALKAGLSDLMNRREYFEQFNAPNGWGLYEHFVPFVEAVLDACEARVSPDALVFALGAAVNRPHDAKESNHRVQPAATEPAKQAGRGPLGCDGLLGADGRSEGKP